VEDASTIPEHFEGSVFLLSLAAGFALVTLLSRIFTSEKSWWALIVSGVLALVGGGILILEMPDTNTLKPLVEAVFNFSNYLWPLVLVAIGVWIIVKKREV
jgi:cadmium resistance protein CadD (predicted permease)